MGVTCTATTCIQSACSLASQACSFLPCNLSEEKCAVQNKSTIGVLLCLELQHQGILLSLVAVRFEGTEFCAREAFLGQTFKGVL